MKLLLIIIEGQLYLATIVAIFAAELGFLFWGFWSRRPIIGLIAVFVAVPLIRTTVSAIRACFSSIRSPEGLRLPQSGSAGLHGLVEEIRCAIDAPPVDAIVITGDFDARAVADSPRSWLRRRRTLVLGLPVLTTLSTAELRAVIAHELAHFSSAYDPFAAWVYRTRLSWISLRAALDRRLATPVYVYWFIRWYVPRLNAASAEVFRRHEFAADRIASRIAGSRAAADALVVFESGARFADGTHWPSIQSSWRSADEPPRPYRQMLTWNARRESPDALNALVADGTELEDTHPALRERLERLGEPLRPPPAAVRSAGEELLGAELEQLAGRLDAEWITQHGASWQAHRTEYLERRAALDRLAALESPTPEELFERAEVVEALRGSGEALPLYESAAERGHAAASLAAGRVLLERMDSRGIALVEASMDRDDNLVTTACRILSEYYTETNQELAARRCEWRASRHATRVRLGEPSTPPS